MIQKLSNEDALEFYEELNELKNKYLAEISYSSVIELKSLLARITSRILIEQSSSFPTLFSKLSYIFGNYNITPKLKIQLSQFRYKSKQSDFCSKITISEYYGIFSGLGYYIQQLSEVPQPNWLIPINQKAKFFKITQTSKSANKLKFEYYTVVNVSNDELVVEDEKQERFSLTLDIETIEIHKESILLLQSSDKICLLEVSVEDNIIVQFDHLVYEPDFTVDISAIAATVKNLNNETHFIWQNYFVSSLVMSEASCPMLKGNIVNDLLDAWIYADSSNPPLFMEEFTSSFSKYATTYTELFKDDQSLISFMQETTLQNDNLRRVVTNDLPNILKTDSARNILLEPSFISNKYGIQGRLDLLFQDNNKSVIIELKSGRLPFPDNDSTRVDDSHAAQARLYELMLSSVNKSKRNNYNSYILYSAASESGIRFVAPFKSFEQKLIHTRNSIVRRIKDIANATDNELENILLQFKYDNLGIQLDERLNWARRDFDNVFSCLIGCSLIEKKYFKAFYRFIYTELLIHKIGDNISSIGSASVWNKEDNVESQTNHLSGLTIINNNSNHPTNPTIELSLEDFQLMSTKSIRVGDSCILYQQKSIKDLATDNQIFKTSIVEISSVNKTITLRPNYSQNKAISSIIFNNEYKWAIDQDYFDFSFSSMLRSLFKLINSPGKKRSILIGKEMPKEYNSELKEIISESITPNKDSRLEQNQILSNALDSNDYFLIIGPPGTGKTSIMLKHLVQELYNQDENKSILLLAYTNRAVDEICDAVNNATNDFNTNTATKKTKLNFIRIGSGRSIAERHKKNLLVNACDGISNRDQLKELFEVHRIFISTVSSIGSNQNIFSLKEFDTVIIDEASQILEPQIIGLLPNFKKFILIGDQKQLPAISLQSTEKAKRFDKELNQLAFDDLRVSYFERLLNNAINKGWNHVHGMLSYQGRMHHQIAQFPNHSYYGGKLKIAGLPHQTANLPFTNFQNETQKELGKKRLLFYPSYTAETEITLKSNRYEAELVATLVKDIKELYALNEGLSLDSSDSPRKLSYNKKQTIGIITPYRSQIALIKSILESQEVPDWQDINVDTVERYQGSQRDIIILSLAVNNHSQLKFLTDQAYFDSKSNRFIDRKLNVAITRAREQLILIGNPYLLKQDSNYNDLIDYIRIRAGYLEPNIKLLPEDILSYNQINLKEVKQEEVIIPTLETEALFDELITARIKAESPDYPDKILGEDGVFNRQVVLEYGRADFDQSLITHTSEQRVLLYCYYNMRKHFFTQLAVLQSFGTDFLKLLTNQKDNLFILDFGCGPGTAAIAYQSYFKKYEKEIATAYVGIDISQSMLKEASKYLSSSFFDKSFIHNLSTSFANEQLEAIKEQLKTNSVIIFNYSYLFANINKTVAMKLTDSVNQICSKFPLATKYIIYQNSTKDSRSNSYNIFKEHIPDFEIIKSENALFSYKNKSYQTSIKAEKVYYEILKL